MGFYRCRRIVVFSIWYILSSTGLATAQTRDSSVDDEDFTQFSGEISEDGVVNYPAEYFQRYQPNTALDMVRQVPGFRIIGGGPQRGGQQQRGFTGSSGNILIDGRRPSTKQDGPFQILSRVPASRVDSIELIRAAVRDIDMQGNTVVVNVRLNGEAPMAVRWQTYTEKNVEYDPLSLGGNISISHNWKGIEYNTGFNINRFIFSDISAEEIRDGDGVLTEERFDHGINKNTRASINLNASTWLGNTLFQVNSEFEVAKRDGFKTTLREPQFSELNSDLFDDNNDETRIELGIDMERNLWEDFAGKLILIYNGEDETLSSFRESLDVTGERTGTRVKDTNEFESESIARLEFDWSGWSGHTVNLNLEGAYNLLDNSELEIEDEGDGPVVVNVPGSNIRVEEVRGDFLLQDVWSIGKIVMELGFGAEISRMTQSGDANQVRNFFFFKPSGVLTYSPDQVKKITLTLKREVSQLDFNDFVSATILEDDDELALGNPNLRPDTTWLVDLNYEHRFGDVGVIQITGYYRWISDVVDLLPLTDTEEAPGNIGNGTRWAVLVEGTAPLDWLGLTNAKLNFNFRRRGTEVIDPVTNKLREFSLNDPRNLKYSHNFNFAWGWNTNYQSDRPFFKVNELDVRSPGIDLNTFIETTRWFSLKIRLSVNNILNSIDTRERTIFEGRRDLSPVDSLRFDKNTQGREVNLSLSGSF
jgi:outer membrane receptor for ferrienterochelin and colicins